MGQNLTFQSTVYKAEGNQGLGEWRAQFVSGDQNLAGAFGNAAAKHSLRTMGGVVQLNQTQLQERIAQLQEKGGHESTVEQLSKGAKAIEVRLATPAKAPAAPSAQGARL